MNASTAVLRTVDLSSGYDDVPVIANVNIDVHAGQIVALLGANGAGKTTTLRTLAGEIPPLAGEIILDGAATTAPTHRRARQGVAYIADERSTIRSLSLLDNLRLARIDPDDAFAICPELSSLAKRPAGALSGGEQQMLTVARALARKPRVLLADELSLGLAPKLVERIMLALRAAADGRSLAVLVVEQHVHVALEIADFAYVLRRGEIVMGGTARSLAARQGDIEAHYLTSDPAT